VLAVTEETILDWLRQAAQRAAEIIEHLLRELPVTQVQLDEMRDFIERKQAKEGGPDREALSTSEDGRQWARISHATELLQRTQPDEKASLLLPDLLQLPKITYEPPTAIGAPRSTSRRFDSVQMATSNTSDGRWAYEPCLVFQRVLPTPKSEPIRVQGISG
jgi:hypothetical protein